MLLAIFAHYWSASGAYPEKIFAEANLISCEYEMIGINIISMSCRILPLSLGACVNGKSDQEVHYSYNFNA